MSYKIVILNKYHVALWDEAEITTNTLKVTLMIVFCGIKPNFDHFKNVIRSNIMVCLILCIIVLLNAHQNP